MKIPEHIRKLDDDDAEYTVDDELDFMGGQIRMLCHVIVQMVHSEFGCVEFSTVGSLRTES